MTAQLNLNGAQLAAGVSGQYRACGPLPIIFTEITCRLSQCGDDTIRGQWLSDNARGKRQYRLRRHTHVSRDGIATCHGR